jgi:2-octaprenyl-6-methoxyphenol hydroxylase
MASPSAPPVPHSWSDRPGASPLDCPIEHSAASLPPHTDIAIVGGGIVGLTLACALAASGLHITILEAQPFAQGLNNRRAYALTLLTGDIFQGLGLWDQIRPYITAFEQIRLSDGNYHKTVKLKAEHLRRSALGYVGEHRVLIQALGHKLATLPNVTWLTETQVERIDYGHDRATVHGRLPDGTPYPLQTPLVVAADGSNSPLRRAAGIRTLGWAYWQSCIGFTVRTPQPHGNIAHERFWPSGPFAILPLPDQRCQVVWTAPHPEAQRLAALPESEFLPLLMERYGSHSGPVTLGSPRQVFPVRLMHSDRYVAPRLALVGDAAHCCHPVGGQGMNLGIRDAVALGEVIAHAHAQGQDWGSLGVLKGYQRWRKAENWVILGFTDFLDRSFSNQWWPLVGLRRGGLYLLQHLAPLRTLALGLMTGQLGRKPTIAQPTPDGFSPNPEP